MEGYILKWTNYIFGWQSRYLILHNGVLYYCKEKGSAQRGAISLNISKIEKHPSNSKRFMITTGTAAIYFKAFTSQDANDWIRALLDHQLDLKYIETRLDAPTTSAIILDKISAMWGIHSQLLNAIELIPSQKSLDGILNLLNEMKNISANTLGIIEHEHEKIQSSPMKINRFSCEGAPPEHDFEEAEHGEGLLLTDDDEFEDAECGEEGLKRHSLPMLRIPKKFISLWEGLKECISQQFPNVLLPLKYYEPLTLLQRLSEEFEFVEILIKASQAESVEKALALVLAFIAAGFNRPARLARPFNSMMGETFELRSHGAQVLLEQVAWNTSAMHCGAQGFDYFASTEIVTQYSNNQLEVSPVGLVYLKHKLLKDTLNWNRPKVVVQGLANGKILAFASGEIRVTSQNSETYGVLTFTQTGIQGKVLRGQEEIWKLSLHSFISLESNDETIQLPLGKADDLNEYCYNFSVFALQLNLPPILFEKLIETDSRHRNDVRALEEGNLAECEKKYTNNCRLSEDTKQTFKAKWFRKGKDWEFTDKYWKRYD